MTIEAARDVAGLIDGKNGLVDRRIFSDPAIYEMELERIFARAWNFMAHDSQIPNPGDFFLTYIGEDRVIVVRDKDMQVQVLINSCRHRGNAVCRAEEGHATSFMCTYHGWTYDLKGALVGVPGFKEVYHEDINREEWGLIRAAQVSTYKGFTFATLDPDAPAFMDYLGPVGKMSLDVIAERGEDLVVAGGIQKYTIGCNWKFAVDNVWDYYHGYISHASFFMSGWKQMRRPASPVNTFPHLAILGEYGHAIGGPESATGATTLSDDRTWRLRPEAREAVGGLIDRVGGHPHIFPNFWVTFPGVAQVSMRMPKGPLKTEIWWFTFVDRATPEKHSAQLRDAIGTFGPAGIAEQDDGENWDQSTRGTLGTVVRRYPLHYAMNLGRGEIIKDEVGPTRVETAGISEHAQLWHYRSWAAWTAADNWAELKTIHPLPRGTV